MRQVPHYCLIGNGRMATHMAHYLTLCRLPFSQWHRKSSCSLKQIILNCSHVLILISDQAIDPFVKQHACLQNKTRVHFSGALASNYAYTAHPLCTFSSTLFTLTEYKKIAFIIEQSGPRFQQLLPGLTNPHYSIHQHQKHLYHSLCVMANNFTTLLWQKLLKEFEQQLHIPTQAAMPLLQATMNSLAADHNSALTGPLVRNDQCTLEKNMQALAGDPYQAVFNAFVTAYQKENPHEDP